MFQKKVYAARLRQLRAERNEAQNVLADLLGVSINQISEMERGRKTTTFDRLVLLCEHYNISADYILGLTDEPKALTDEENREN